MTSIQLTDVGRIERTEIITIAREALVIYTQFRTRGIVGSKRVVVAEITGLLYFFASNKCELCWKKKFWLAERWCTHKVLGSK